MRGRRIEPWARQGDARRAAPALAPKSAPRRTIQKTLFGTSLATDINAGSVVLGHVQG